MYICALVTPRPGAELCFDQGESRLPQILFFFWNLLYIYIYIYIYFNYIYIFFILNLYYENYNKR